MIICDTKLDRFIVEPGAKLKKFDPKLIKEICRNHPYKLLLWYLFKYCPSYDNREENDANPDRDGYEDVTDFYFRLLDDYTRYGIAFNRESELFPDNKLGVEEDKEDGKPFYCLVDNDYDKKTLLFNKVKTIDLNEHDTGEKPLSEREKMKRDIIKKIRNKKLQVAMMDPDVYSNDKNFINTLVNGSDDLLIEKFNHRMSWHGLYDFLRINFD